MLKATLRAFRPGALSTDDAMAELMQGGMKPNEAAEILTTYSSGPSANARRLDEFRKNNPVLGEELAPTNLPTFEQQARADADAIARLDADAQKAAEGRAAHQEIIDSLPSNPVKNAVHAALQVVPEFIRMGAQTGQFLTGGAMGKDTENLMANVAADITRDYASPKLQEQQKLMANTLQTADPGAVLDFLRSNPGGAATLSAPSLAASAGGLGAGSAGVASILRNVFRLGPQTTGRIAGNIANYGNAALNAGQTYAQNADEGVDPAANLIGSLLTAAQTRLIGKRLDGGAEGMLASRLVGGGSAPNTLRQLGTMVAKSAGKGALDELNDNVSVETGSALAKGERPDLVKAVTEAIPDMLAGGVLGGATNVRQTEPAPVPRASSVPLLREMRGTLQKQKAELEAQKKAEADAARAAEEAASQKIQPPSENQEQANKVLAGLQTLYARSPEEQTANTQQKPQEEQKPKWMQDSAAPEVATVNRDSAPGEMVLQNRDRSSPASINQMTRIAADPDYGMLSEGRDFANGAPVVAYAGENIPAQQRGRQSYAVTANHERIPVQYAVVDAGSVLTSNAADGTTNVRYADKTVPGVRAIAGNGRIAGLTRAYEQGTAAKYRQELKDDAAMHGIDPQIIDGMKAPVLVRIMPDDKVTANIGDVSNSGGGLNLSPVERAKNDVRRIDVGKLEFAENGDATEDTVRAFTRGMPSNELADLIDRDGTPTRQAHERFKAAAFRAAFNSDELLRLYSQEADPELRTLLGAMGDVAAHFARLEGCGDLDIRELVTEAAALVVNAKRSGQSYADYISNAGLLDGDPAAAKIALAIVENLRSKSAIVQMLEEAADFAYQEATKPGDTLWGPAERATREQIVDRMIKGDENGNAIRTDAVEDSASDGATGAGNGAADQSSEGRQDLRERAQDLEQSGRDEPPQQNVQREADRTAVDGEGSRDAGDAQEALSFEESEPVTQARPDQAVDENAKSEATAEASGKAEAVADSLASDRSIGNAFEELTQSGAVTVVESVDALPAEVREQLESAKLSRASDVSKELRYQNALAKLQRALRDRTSAHHFVFNDELDGWVDLDWGRIGWFVDEAFGTRGAMGLSHIIDKRSLADRLAPEDVAAMLRKLVRTLVSGKKVRNGNSLFLSYDGFSARISRTNTQQKRETGNHYVITGFGSISRVAEESPSTSLGETGLIPATSVALHRKDEGSRNKNISAIADIILQNQLLVKQSTDGDIQGVFDPRTGKTYLIASNLSEKTAKGVFLHEVGVHMANADKRLEPIIRQARVMLINGFNSGDAVARRVKERLVAAGELESVEDPIPSSVAEEAMAYTVEEVYNHDNRTPWGRWWGRLVSAIKRWLIERGINVSLTPENLVDIAIGAAEGLKGAPVAAADRMRFSRGFDDVPMSAAEARRKQAPKSALFGRDALGARTFAPGEKLYSAISKGLKSLVLERAQLVPLPPELRMQFRAYKAEEDRGSRTALQAADLMKEMSEQERSLLSDVIEGEIKTGFVPPQSIVDTAAFMTDIIDGESKELVELGMLSQESYDRYKGRYLPRFYDKAKTSEELGFFKKMFPSSPLKGIYGDHLKGRGIFKNAESQTVAHFVKLGWEVRDPDWKWEEGQLVPKSGQESTEKTPPDGTQIGLWRDWSKTEREQMGEIRDAGFRFTMGQIETSKTLALGRFYKWLAGQSEYVRTTESEGYSHVPETEITGTGGVKRYGALAGKWVRNDVFSSISKTDQVENIATRAWRQALAIWKEGKTAMNPVSHYNNTVGNWMACSFAGIGLTDVRAYVKGFRSLLKRDIDYLEAEDAGLFTGSFTREEIAQSLPPAFREYLLSAEDKSIVTRTGDIMMNVLTWGLRGKLSEMYGMEDDLFKMVLYQHARKQGLTPEEAVDYAHQYVFTYDDLPKGARVLRDSILPFFSWTYKALPMLAKTAIVYPWRFGAPAVLMAAINKLSYIASVAGDEGDWLDKIVKAGELEDAERKLLPKYMQGVGVMMNPKFLRFGRDASTGLPQYLNVSYSAPGGTLFDAENQMGGLPIPEMLMPNTPWIGAYSALIANKDVFSGFEITRETDTSWEAASKRMAWLWKQMTPAIAVGNYHWTRIMNGVASELGTSLPGGYTGVDRYGAPMPLSVALQNLAGIKVRTVDMEKEYEKGMRDIQYEVRSVKSEARSTSRLAARGAVTKEVLEDQLESMREKTGEAAERAREKRKALETVKKLSQ